ncbi:MAG: class I SAM-dependent methyltransferase [Caldilineales bacterium]|nr:class I SAM-dependent methyltransferase [Caldilineales bacterium]
MRLIDIINRQGVPEPWAEGEKIPWNDPAFSARMLAEHLSQAHDAASRRAEIIDRHVAWIHDDVLRGQPTRILDLGCGPGLYSNRLAQLGYQCTGIDFSPASITYAREQAVRTGVSSTFILDDIRTADFGAGYGLVMLIFGEFNVFRPAEARDILVRAHRALEPDGILLLEPHTFAQVQGLGQQPRSWFSAGQGLFGDEPHLVLRESFWNEAQNVAIERYYVIDGATTEAACHSSSTQAYADEEYRSMLAECGFGEVAFYPVLGGQMTDDPYDLPCLIARKQPR